MTDFVRLCGPRRASMGWVYFIAPRDRGTVLELARVKIGFSRLATKGRLSALQCGSPVILELLAEVRCHERTERELHRKFAEFRLHGEWFRLEGSLQRLIELLQDGVDCALTDLLRTEAA